MICLKCRTRLFAGIVAFCLASPLHAQATPAERSLRISVVDDAGRPVEGAYVALVPEDRPWSEPAREEILTRRSEVVWELDGIPRGLAVRIAAGAPGYSTEQTPPIFLAPSSASENTVRLQRLEPLPGRVTDTEGEPVVGARVGQIRAFAHGFGLRLSETGRSHLLPTWAVTTDDEGRFALPLDPRGGHNVVAQAPGFAPVLLPNVTPESPKMKPTDFLEVTLEPGAGLELDLTVPEGADLDGRVWVELASEATAGGPTAADFRVLWRRSLPSAGGRLVWESLQPGMYEVRLHAAVLGAHGVAPVSVGEVTLAAGQRKTLRFSLPVGPITSKASNAPPLALLLAGVAADTLEGMAVEIWSADGVAVPAEGTVEPVSGGVVLQVPGGCRAGAHVLVKTEDRIAAVGPVEPVANACETTLRSTLRPLGEVRATLLAPRPSDGERLPDRGLLRLADCPTGARPGSGVEPLERLEVPVRLLPPGDGEPRRPERALLAAPLPADCGWTALSVGQFAPVEIPAPERAEAGVRVALGRVELHHGGAILARVVGGDGIALEAARLDAWPHEEGGDVGPRHPDTDPSARRIASGVTGEHGWVRLYGLPPGAVELLVSWEDRQVPHRAPHVVVGAREEVLVDPLVVPPSSSLTLELVGRSRLSTAGLLPYHVTLSWRGGSSPPSVQQLSRSLQEVPAEIVIEEIPAGRWAVTGSAWMDGVGSQLRPVAETEVMIAPGEQVQTSLVFDHLVFEGKITLRGEPVSGSASFVPVPWDDRRGMTVRLDEDGEFRIPLERAGSYTLQVMSRERGVSGALVPEALFDDPDVEHEFRLDEGRVAGRALTGDGEPVAGVWIDFLAFRDPAAPEAGVGSLRRRVRTDETGVFELDAVSPGLWTVQVEDDQGARASETLSLEPGEWRLGLDLTLEDRSVEGWVRDLLGAAVAGARGVLIFEPSRVGAVPIVRAFDTDSDGRFEVRADSPWHATIQVQTPNEVWHAGRLSSQAPVLEVSSSSGGQLEVLLPEGNSARWRATGLWLVHEETGGYLDLFKTGRSFMTSEGRLAGYRVSNLASGNWRLVTTPDLASLDGLYRGLAARLPPLAEITVSDGETVDVALRTENSTNRDRKEER